MNSRPPRRQDRPSYDDRARDTMIFVGLVIGLSVIGLLIMFSAISR